METNAQLLFNKFLNNQCSLEEAEQLIRLLSANEEDSIYKDMVLAQLVSPVKEEAVSRELQTRLDQRLQQILAGDAPVIRLQSAAKRDNYLKYAAAAIILLCLSFGAYLLLHQPAAKLVVYNQQHDIAPGGNKAILTLAGGKKIVLTDARNGQVASQNKVAVEKTANGQLVYQAEPAISNEVVYNTLTTPRGGQYNLTLADGTKVTLNAASSITYPTSFSGKERKVELKGEAYFEVAHNKDMPFRVETQTHQVEVFGTHFNVNAYDDEPAAKTTLLEGSVKIIKGTEQQMLIPGQQATIAGHIKVANADTEEAVAWKNGDFIFNDEHIESIMRKISRWYNVDIAYQGQPTTEGFGATISRAKNISVVLSVLEKTGAVHFKVEGRRVTVMP